MLFIIFSHDFKSLTSFRFFMYQWLIFLIIFSCVTVGIISITVLCVVELNEISSTYDTIYFKLTLKSKKLTSATTTVLSQFLFVYDTLSRQTIENPFILITFVHSTFYNATLCLNILTMLGWPLDNAMKTIQHPMSSEYCIQHDLFHRTMVPQTLITTWVSHVFIYELYVFYFQQVVNSHFEQTNSTIQQIYIFGIRYP